MWIVGIDPGKTGALAFLNPVENTLRLVDIPVFEYVTTKKRTKLDTMEICRELRQQDVTHVYLEEVFSSPQMGVTSAFNFGETKGTLIGICAALDIPLTQVKPAAWKKAMRAPADGNASVMRASQLFPALSPLFYGPRGAAYHDRAEACMLALFGAMELGHTPTAPVQRVM